MLEVGRCSYATIAITFSCTSYKLQVIFSPLHIRLNSLKGKQGDSEKRLLIVGTLREYPQNLAMKLINQLSFSRIACLSLNRQRYREALQDCYMSIFTCLLSWLAALRATVIWNMTFWGTCSNDADPALYFGRIVPECAIKFVQVSFSGKKFLLHRPTQSTLSVCTTAGDFSTHCSVYHTSHQCCFSELFRSAVTISNWKWILHSEPDSQCQSADSKGWI